MHSPEDLQRTIRAERLRQGGFRWHRYVSEAELSDFYRGARAFAFLSEYEGLGLTPLEALAANDPRAPRHPVARESCGEAALPSSGDLAETARALEQVLADDDVSFATAGPSPTRARQIHLV